jgi:1,4-dihydroxy-2-naphthoate polyprenyltransferase
MLWYLLSSREFTIVNLIYFKQIVKLARMPIVLAVIPIFLIGILFAIRSGKVFSFLNFLWGLSILLIIEVAASFANDYFDYDADKYNKQFGFSGGSGVLLAYPQLLPFAKWASILMFLSALLLTSIFIILTAFPLWGIGYIGVAVFFCWFYTAPPFRFVYRGLGEIPHLLAGVMFPGWGYFIMTGTITADLLIFAIPFGLLGLTVILNFEIPDREADIHGGKHNLVVRKGRHFTFTLIMLLYLASALYFFMLSLISPTHAYLPLVLIALLTCVPFSISLVPVIKKTNQPDQTTRYAIRNASSGFLTVFLIMCLLFV